MAVKCPTLEQLRSKKRISEMAASFQKSDKAREEYDRKVQKEIDRVMAEINKVLGKKKEARIKLDIKIASTGLYESVRRILEKNKYKFKELADGDTAKHGLHWLIDLS